MTKARRTKRGNRYIMLLGYIVAAVFIVLGLMSALAEPSHALGVPGIEVCPKSAPFAQTPQDGLAGLLGERPIEITTDNSPQHLWTTGGFAGMTPHTYDLGCALDPTSWMKTANASTDAQISGAINSVGDAMVSLTDSVDRRAWQPGWVTTALKGFANRASGIIDQRIIIPFAGLGILLGALKVLRTATDGNVSGALTSAGWMFTVTLVSGVLLLGPIAASQWTQSGGGFLVATLNNGANASDSTTNDIVYSVQYQGWLRRTFGSAQTEVAAKYGPDLLASERVSWAELDANDTPAKRNDLAETKAKQFKAIAAKVKEDDPIAYRSLTGENTSSIESLAQLAFAFFACFFRLATSLLIIIATLMLVFLAVIWLAATPLLLIPEAQVKRFGGGGMKMGGGRMGGGGMHNRFGSGSPGSGRLRFSGQDLARSLSESATRAIGYVLVAAIGSWLFNVFLQACLAPGLNMWWSLLLLILGTGVGWTMIRPDLKAMSILSLGHVQGYGVVAKLLKGWAMGTLIGSVAGSKVAKAEEKEEPVERMSENDPSVPPSAPVYADIYHPDKIFTPEQPTHVDGEPLPSAPAPRVITSMPHYERPVDDGDDATVTPPNSDASSPYIPYDRTDEGANHG